MLMGNVLADMEKSRMKLYGFDKQKSTKTEVEFIPPGPPQSFNSKLHNTTHSQDILMNDIVNDIAKKENRYYNGNRM